MMIKTMTSQRSNIPIDEFVNQFGGAFIPSHEYETDIMSTSVVFVIAISLWLVFRVMIIFRNCISCCWCCKQAATTFASWLIQTKENQQRNSMKHQLNALGHIFCSHLIVFLYFDMFSSVVNLMYLMTLSINETLHSV